MKIYFKKNNKQSAFSLIEVLIALVILSFGIIGSAKLLEESTVGYQMAEQHTEAMLIASAIVDSISLDREGMTTDRLRYDWQNKLDQVFPGSHLTIEHQQLEDKCVYTITLFFALPTLKPFTVKVAVLGVSLVNLLVSMTIGLVILTAAMHWYQIVKIRMLQENNQRQVLDSGRTIFQFIGRDLKSCGYKGCRTADQNYPIRRNFGDTGSPHQFLRTDRAVFGFLAERGACQYYIPSQFCQHIKTDSDVLVIYNIPQKILTLKKSMLKPEDALIVEQAKHIKENAMVLISDALQGDVFIANHVKDEKIKHQLGGNLNSTLNLSKCYQQGAEITELQTVVYYIGVPDRPTAQSGSYALFRSDIRKKPREIVAGIVDFSVEYGFWDPADDANPGFQYYRASLIKPEQWALVRIVRLKIEAKGEVYHGISQQNRHWEYAFAIRNGHRVNAGAGST